MTEVPHIKCIVKGCVNHTDEGGFVKNLCLPCYNYLKTGRIGPTTSFLGEMRKTIEVLENKITMDRLAVNQFKKLMEDT